jgi:hypothetical protein
MPKANTNTFMIAAYGEEADRARLLILAEAEGMSMSQWLLSRLRSAYSELYGDADPQQVITDNNVRSRSWGRFRHQGEVDATPDQPSRSENHSGV